MEINLVTEAFKFMLLGMGVVFSFLIVMVIALKTQTLIITKYFINRQKQIHKEKQINKQDPKIIAAITAAIQHHNKIKG